MQECLCPCPSWAIQDFSIGNHTLPLNFPTLANKIKRILHGRMHKSTCSRQFLVESLFPGNFECVKLIIKSKRHMIPLTLVLNIAFEWLTTKRKKVLFVKQLWLLHVTFKIILWERKQLECNSLLKLNRKGFQQKRSMKSISHCIARNEYIFILWWKQCW